MDKENSRQIFISNIPYETREKDLRYKFDRYGEIKSFNLKTGFAFVEYFEPNSCREAIEDMDGRTFEGSRLVVKIAYDRRQRFNNNNGMGRGAMNNNNGNNNGGGFMNKSRGPQPDDTCNNCHQKGHW